MDDALLEELLYDTEGPSLDFKRDQYEFVRASDHDKSKLLKDVLAFANSWRRNDAYILIGIEEAKGGRSNPVGITSDLDDADLQQFVNSKTNRKVIFSYRTYLHGDRRLGIIQIPKQERPAYSTVNFGVVKKGVVYFRSGSSCAEATPEDIARMGATDAAEQTTDPVIRLVMVDDKTSQVLGQEVDVRSVLHALHSNDDLPDAAESAGSDIVSSYIERSLRRINTDYWRELAYYLWCKKTFRRISLAAINGGGTLANNVTAVVEIPKDENMLLMDESDFPDFPEWKSDLIKPVKLSRIPVFHHSTGVHIKDLGDRQQVTISFGAIQPQAQVVVEEQILLAARESTTVELRCLIYGDEISQPQEATLKLNWHVDKASPLTMDDLRKVDAQDESER